MCLWVGGKRAAEVAIHYFISQRDYCVYNVCVHTVLMCFNWNSVVTMHILA